MCAICLDEENIVLPCNHSILCKECVLQEEIIRNTTMSIWRKKCCQSWKSFDSWNRNSGCPRALCTV